MTTFNDKSELEQYLRGINPSYDRYAEDLWRSEVTSASQLGNASLATLLACGVTKPLHAEDIIAQSKFRGKCSLRRVASVQLASDHEHVWTVLLLMMCSPHCMCLQYCQVLVCLANIPMASQALCTRSFLNSTDMLARGLIPK